MSERVSNLPLIDAQEVAKLIGVPQGTVRHFAREGRLPFVRVGRRVMFSRPEIEKVVQTAIESGEGI